MAVFFCMIRQVWNKESHIIISFRWTGMWGNDPGHWYREWLTVIPVTIMFDHIVWLMIGVHFFVAVTAVLVSCACFCRLILAFRKRRKRTSCLSRTHFDYGIRRQQPLGEWNQCFRVCVCFSCLFLLSLDDRVWPAFLPDCTSNYVHYDSSPTRRPVWLPRLTCRSLWEQ